VEGRDLLGAGEAAQLVVGELERAVDEAVDPEPPGRRVEARHRRRDGVDPPALRRHEARRQRVAEGRGRAGERAPDGVAPDERREPERGHAQEGAAPV